METASRLMGNDMELTQICVRLCLDLGLEKLARLMVWSGNRLARSWESPVNERPIVSRCPAARSSENGFIPVANVEAPSSE